MRKLALFMALIFMLLGRGATELQGVGRASDIANLDDIDFPVFYTTTEHEADEEALARYLFIQYLELARHGKAVTGRWYNYGILKRNFDRLDDYRINEIGHVTLTGDKLRFTVDFDVKPTGGTERSDWSAGNGRFDVEGGWIVGKTLFVNFEKVEGGFQKGEFGTGP